MTRARCKMDAPCLAAVAILVVEVLGSAEHEVGSDLAVLFVVALLHFREVVVPRVVAEGVYAKGGSVGIALGKVGEVLNEVEERLGAVRIRV